MAGNHNSGRHAIPIGDHLERGTYRGDKHGPIPDAAQGEPARPRSLKGEARKWWDRNVPDLVSRGLAKAIDTDALAQLAWLHGVIEKSKKVAEKDPTDPIAKNAVVAYLSQYNALARDFGLSYGRRQKLKIKPAPEGRSGVESRKRS